MPECEVVLDDTHLNQGPCPHTNAPGWEHDGAYYCIFHIPESAKQGQEWSIGNERNKLFVEAIEEYGIGVQKRNKQLNPENRLSLDMRQTVFCQIPGMKDLIGTDIFGSADFQRCIFMGNATLDGLAIHKTANYMYCEFRGSSSFRELKVLDGQPSIFSFSIFAEDVDFASANFSGPVNFSDSRIGGVGYFGDSEFIAVSFKNTVFTHGLSFGGGICRGVVNLQKIVVGDEAANMTEAFLDLTSRQFLGEVNFTGSGLHCITTMNATVFQNFVDFRKVIFARAPSMVGIDVKENIDFTDCEFGEGNIYTFRKIKRLMEEQRSMWEATRFYGYELSEERIAHTYREKDLYLNWIYFLLNDYGRAWFRPFELLPTVTLLFGVLYYGIGGYRLVQAEELIGWEKSIPKSAEFWHAMVFSAQTLKLSWMFGRQISYPTKWWTWALSGIQSVVNVLLYAMAILSIRRRFKL